MRVEFVFGSLLALRVFFQVLRFPLSSKTNISKFQFDLEFEGHRFVRLLGATLVKQSLFIYLFILTHDPVMQLQHSHQ